MLMTVCDAKSQRCGKELFRLTWRATDAVSSTTLHPTGSVLATCSGQRHFSASDHLGPISNSEDESESGDDDSSTTNSSAPSSNTSDLTPVATKDFDNSLKIWAL